MLKQTVEEVGRHRVVLMDSVSTVTQEDAGHVVVTGSHGGLSSAEYGVKHAFLAVFFNDAGIGKDRAGLAGLATLQRSGIPGGTVSNTSARIGDARDTWESGVISSLNERAREAGFREGQPLQDEVRRFLRQEAVI